MDKKMKKMIIKEIGNIGKIYEDDKTIYCELSYSYLTNMCNNSFINKLTLKSVSDICKKNIVYIIKNFNFENVVRIDGKNVDMRIMDCNFYSDYNLINGNNISLSNVTFYDNDSKLVIAAESVDIFNRVFVDNLIVNSNKIDIDSSFIKCKNITIETDGLIMSDGDIHCDECNIDSGYIYIQTFYVEATKKVDITTPISFDTESFITNSLEYNGRKISESDRLLIKNNYEEYCEKEIARKSFTNVMKEYFNLVNNKIENEINNLNNSKAIKVLKK